jgi:signal transduction histidine kinase/DNA-binding response OmpR family regulator
MILRGTIGFAMPKQPPINQALNFQRILEHAPDLYLILNPQFYIVGVSDAYLNATMTKREEIMGRHLFEVFPDNPDDPQATGVSNLMDSLQRALASKKADAMAVQKYDVRRHGSNDFEERYWSPVNTPVLNDVGEVIYLLHRAEDVTDYVRERQETEELRTHAGKMEAEVLRRAQDIQEANKLLRYTNEDLAGLLNARQKVETIKNEFISVVSHELRTPLTSIHGALGLVLGGAVGEYSEKIKKLLTVADNNCLRLIRLVNDILDIEKIEAGKMIFDLQPVDLNKLLDETIKSNQMFAEKFDIKLGFYPVTETIFVNVDAGRLTQVVTNLISNAAKFSKASGCVSVMMEVHDKKIRVSIADEGQGIPEEFRSKIFEKFSQADSSSTRKEGGTGLGLAISKAIIEKLGGEMNFVSQMGKGSIFYFDLPIIIEAIATTDQVTPPASAGKILICEDDESQANYLNAYLEAAGYDVDICGTAKQARILLKKNHYAALCLDLMLPDQDGISFIKELRQTGESADLSIIIVSAIAKDGKEMLNGDAVEVLDWIDKPVDMQRLLSAFSTIKTLAKKRIPKILHIEDDLSVQQMVATLLSENAEVKTVSTIAETKNILQAHKFDLAILDLMLPDGAGIELLALIAKANIPVIVLANSELDGQYAQFVQGALLKDKTSPQQLLAKIETVLRSHS